MNQTEARDIAMGLAGQVPGQAAFLLTIFVKFFDATLKSESVPCPKSKASAKKLF